MSAPNYYALRYKLQLGQLVNETRAEYRKAGRPRPEFTHWLAVLAWRCSVSVKTLRNWASWAAKPDPVNAYERHLHVDREGARWRREMLVWREEWSARMAYARQAGGWAAGDRGA